MGMYDSIYIDVKCPECGEESFLECQTKDLDCELREYFMGDHVLSNKILTEMTEKAKHLYCTAECRSKECIRPIKTIKGYESARGHFFHLYVILRGGIITGEYINIIGKA